MTSKIPTQPPRFKNVDIREEIAKTDRKPERYPVYQFTGRTFTKEDRPGKPPQQQT
jgi:hypothetical protein